jgi:hypothetical protein
MAPMCHVAAFQLDKVAATQLAIDGGVERGQFSDAVFEIESNPDRPDFLKLAWRFGACQLAFVPGLSMCRRCRFVGGR